MLEERQFKPTPAQESVIKSSAETLLVSASAGCGKTTVMIEKIVSLIESGASLKGTVVCTFTKAAASDMRQKLYSSLTNLAASGNQAAICALKELPLAQISTLHSFCQQLIKSHFYAVDIDPNFEILSEHDSKTYLASAIEKTVERFYNDTESPYYNDFLLMYEVLLKRRKPELLCELIRRVHQFAFVQADPIFWLDNAAKFCDSHSLLLEELAGLGDIDLSKASDPMPTKQFVEILAQMVKEADIEYKKEKQKKSFLDYSDLEHLTLLVLSDKAASEQITLKYKYLFVDEYQDINPIQEKIISKINAVKFFVGDVKQSIYGFRLCNPDIFVDKYQSFKNGKGGEAIDLNSNFRSKPFILRFCNDVFSRAMTPQFGKVDYKNDAAFILDKHTSSDDNDRVKVLLAVKEKSQGLEPEDVYSVKEHTFSEEQDGEAGLVVGEVLDLIASGSKFSDIAILLRAQNTDFAKNLSKKLSAAGIRAALSEKKRADECVGSSVLLSYLRLIDNHNDDINLAAVMRSCFGGFSDEDLASIRKSFNEGFFYEAAYKCLKDKEFPLNARLKDFFDRLDYLTEVSKSVSVSELAGMICAEGNYFKYILGMSGGGAKAAELSKFLDTVEASAFNYSLFEYIKAIEKNMPEIETSLDEDCVKIMTIHASKGLEFKNVILANANRAYNTKDTSGVMLLDEEYGLCLKHWNVLQKSSEETSLYLKVKDKIAKKNLEEEMRILYVALTRAKDTLTITATVPKNELKIVPPHEAKSYLDLIAPIVEQSAEFVSFEDCGLIGSGVRTSVLYREVKEELFAKIKEYTDFEYSYSDRPVKMSVSAIISGDNADEDEDNKEAFLPYADLERAAMVGNAYHKAMQLISFENDFEHEYNSFCANNTDSFHLLKRDEIEKAFYQIKELVKNKKYYKELPFIMSTDEGTLVQGIIDLCIANNDGYEIIDYKTGRVEGQTKEKYLRQLSLYAQAIEKILKKPVTKKSLYLFGEGKIVDV